MLHFTKNFTNCQTYRIICELTFKNVSERKNMVGPEAVNQDWKTQIIRSRNGSVILPEAFRRSLRQVVNVLGLDQKGIARSVGASEGMVSNLFSGKRPVRNSNFITSMTGLMEQRVTDASFEGILDPERRKGVERIIGDLRDIFNPPILVPDISVTTLRVRSDPNLTDLMLNSLSLVLRQSAILTEQGNLALQDSSQSQEHILAALRMAQLFNETAQMVLKEQGNILFKNPQDAERNTNSDMQQIRTRKTRERRHNLNDSFRMIVELTEAGLTNKEIAERLHFKPNTIRTYTSFLIKQGLIKKREEGSFTGNAVKTTNESSAENISLPTEQMSDSRSQKLTRKRRVRKWVDAEEIVRKASVEENDTLPQYFFRG